MGAKCHSTSDDVNTGNFETGTYKPRQLFREWGNNLVTFFAVQRFRRALQPAHERGFVKDKRKPDLEVIEAALSRKEKKFLQYVYLLIRCPRAYCCHHITFYGTRQRQIPAYIFFLYSPKRIPLTQSRDTSQYFTFSPRQRFQCCAGFPRRIYSTCAQGTIAAVRHGASLDTLSFVGWYKNPLSVNSAKFSFYRNIT